MLEAQHMVYMIKQGKHSKLTGELRYVSDGQQLVLQQQFLVETYADDKLTDAILEWRNVPTFSLEEVNQLPSK